MQSQIVLQDDTPLIAAGEIRIYRSDGTGIIRVLVDARGEQ